MFISLSKKTIAVRYIHLAHDIFVSGLAFIRFVKADCWLRFVQLNLASIVSYYYPVTQNRIRP